jgi:hypothetical protein
MGFHSHAGRHRSDLRVPRDEEAPRKCLQEELGGEKWSMYTVKTEAATKWIPSVTHRRNVRPTCWYNKT